jgi:hypothetical protein
VTSQASPRVPFLVFDDKNAGSPVIHPKEDDMRKARDESALPPRVRRPMGKSGWLRRNFGKSRLHRGEKAIGERPAGLLLVEGEDFIYIALDSGMKLQVHAPPAVRRSPERNAS